MTQDVLPRRVAGQHLDDRIGNLPVARLGRDVAGRAAAGLARHGRVEHHRRHAFDQRLERRQAETLVFRQEGKHGCVTIQLRQRGVIDVRPNADAIAMRGTVADRVEIEARLPGAVLADDLEPRARDAARHILEGRHQPVDAAPLEDRTDEQHDRRTIVQADR